MGRAKILIYSIFLGLMIWLLDAAFYLRYTADTNFIDALITDVPAHKIYLRSLVLLSLVVFGWIMSSTSAREQRAERSKERATRRLDFILSSSHDGIFGVDAQGHFTFANKAAASLLGLKVEDLPGKDAHALIHHSDAEGRACPATSCPILHPPGKSDEVWVTDALFWRSDGKPLSVQYSVRPVEEDGEPEGVVVIFRAISEDELAREELERLRRLSELILKWAGEGIFGIDRQHRITFANPAAAVMLGYEDAELMGQEVHSLLQHARADGTPHPRNQSLIYAAFEDDDVYHVSDEVFWRKTGESVPVEYTATPLREGGEKVGAVVVFQDITERKLAEKDLRQTLGELARSNRELETFAYVVSHDLQEPLRMVQSYVQLLERRYAAELDDAAHDFIKFAVDGARRMQRMIEDLLRYSRVDSQGGEFERVDLNEPLGDALANLAASLEESGATVEADDLPELLVDRTQMTQLFQNLIGNAIKFRGDDPPRVKITSRPHDDSWIIAVEDNGIGIAAEQSERVFAIFQRLHRSEEYAGTGIGLAICKKIAERHGGAIRVESAPGEGATFYVSLPAREDARITA